MMLLHNAGSSGQFVRLQQRPFLLFLPFLAAYCTIVLVFSKDEFTIDEPSYLAFANNLLHGFYSPPPPDIDLWHAPGYPILISPLVALNIPPDGIRLLNALLLYGAVVFFYKLLQQTVSQKMAFWWAVIMGSYWLAWKGLPLIMTECFVFFLVTAVVYAAWLYFKDEKLITRRLFLLSFLTGYLALTRFLFGYVLMAGLLLCILLLLFRRSTRYKQLALVFAFAFLVTVPYLAYTWSLTGRLFYWGNSGGAQIFWISSPAEEEWGDWFTEELEPNESVDGNEPGARERLIANHQDDMNEILQYRGVAKDDAYKRKAWENIRDHPVKYVKNWIANTGRLLFNYPQSYRRPGLGTYVNMIPNMFLVVLSVLMIIPTVKTWKSIPFFIKFLLLLGGIYFAGSTLVSGTIRMFYILFPVIAMWLCYVMHATIRISYQPLSADDR